MRDTRFTSKLWKSLQSALGTKLNFNLGSNWETLLPLVEFTYNNNYQTTIGMAPYETLYGRKCRSPLYWSEVGERKILGPELIRQTVEKITMIQDRIKMSQDRQKSYAYRRRKHIQFDEREKVGDLAYQLALPPSLSSVHNIFHVSMLRKYVHDPSYIMNYKDLTINNNLTYEEAPETILERKIQHLRNKDIALFKVQWRSLGRKEATWKREEEIRVKYPSFFSNSR
ncbi:hypothetical protein DH2020_024458 [Rehmannia glutinosa]|uniref:Chromo domain-containing protein n=1 Tax=Rehmannia glutinosa TaxID=99300 RepID=A0ABR0W5B4_REHGL